MTAAKKAIQSIVPTKNDVKQIKFSKTSLKAKTPKKWKKTGNALIVLGGFIGGVTVLTYGPLIGIVGGGIVAAGKIITIFASE